MIAYVEGRVLEKTESSCLLVTHSGIGYEIFVPTHTLASLPARGEQASLYTAMIVREDSQELFGFSTWDERETFFMLISINRVGARTAVAILSLFRPDDLRRIVAEDDVASLTRVSGIGKQTGQKIFLELKYKLKADGTPVLLPAAEASAGVFRDALTGMLNLGYEETEAGQVLKEVLLKEPDLEVSSALRAALKTMAKRNKTGA